MVSSNPVVVITSWARENLSMREIGEKIDKLLKAGTIARNTLIVVTSAKEAEGWSDWLRVVENAARSAREIIDTLGTAEEVASYA